MAGPEPAIARVRAGVRDLLQERFADRTLAAGDLVLVACSGGPDSVALASQLAFLAPRLDVRAGAVIVDHGLRPESSRVAERAARLCTDAGLDPVSIREVQGLERATETGAREARYAELEAARARSGAVGILLGHTLDDQAETVLLAAARAGGTRALSGMAPVRERYWRPLLDVRRSDTHATCDILGLEYDTDPSNAADGPWQRADGGPVPRAAVRDLVLPALADALGRDPAPALARTARLARADADLLDSLATHAWTRCTREATASTAVVLDIESLNSEPDALRTRVLRRAAIEAGSPAVALLENHILALDALVTRWHGQGEVALPGGVAGRRDCGSLVIARPAGETGPRRDRGEE